MNTKTVYAIYDRRKKKFKNRSGSPYDRQWSDFPAQTYDKLGTVRAALSLHLKSEEWKDKAGWRLDGATPSEDVVIVLVTLSWEGV